MINKKGDKMASMNQINEGYFNYLTKEIFKSIDDANDYNCKDFCIVKLELMMNLYKILESKEKFEKILEILNKNDKKY